jgi:hypothetical protein
MSHSTAKRSGWPVSENDPQPGDTIRFPPALDMSPRGPEQYAWHDNYEQYAETEPDLDVVAVKQGPPQTPACCGFCSACGPVAERGVYEPDYRLVAPDGETVVFTCHACIADAPIVEVSE